jgi:hypothetical protein
MGSFQTTVNRLLRSKAAKKGDEWDLTKAFITKAEDGEEFGKVVVVDVSLNNDASGKRSMSKTKLRGKTEESKLKVDESAALVLTLEGVDMRNVEGWFGCSDPMFFVEKPVQSIDGSTKWHAFYQSEHVDDNLNPQWQPATLALQPLCNCDLDKPIRLSFFDWEEDGRHNPMGHVVTTVNRLLYSQATRKGEEWDLSKALITRSDEGEEFGKIVIVNVSIDPTAGKGAARTLSTKPENKKPEKTRRESPVRSPKREAKDKIKLPAPEKNSPVPAKKSPVPATKLHAPGKGPDETEKPAMKETPALKENESTRDVGATLSVTLEGVDLGKRLCCCRDIELIQRPAHTNT